MSETKIIVVKAEVDSCYGYEYEAKAAIDIYNNINEYLSANHVDCYSIIQTLKKNPNFEEALVAMGYRNLDNLKDNVEKAVWEDRLYYNNSHSQINELNLKTAQNYQARDLAAPNTLLFRTVSKDVLKEMAPEVYREYKRAVKTLENAEKAKAAKAKQNAAKKKQKALDKAKKILQEAGEL